MALGHRDTLSVPSVPGGDCLYCGSLDTHTISVHRANGMFTVHCDSCGRSFATDTLPDDETDA